MPTLLHLVYYVKSSTVGTGQHVYICNLYITNLMDLVSFTKNMWILFVFSVFVYRVYEYVLVHFFFHTLITL